MQRVIGGAVMIGKERSEASVATVYDAFEILEKKKKEGGELGYEQQLAYDHIAKIKKMSKEKAEKLAEELEEIGLSRKAIAKIIEIMPLNELQLRQVLIIERKQFADDEIKKMLDAIARYKK
ncbi:MAG: hypothetical protein QXF41_03690 [Candidatus Micrarchaeaceae archaeon]